MKNNKNSNVKTEEVQRSFSIKEDEVIVVGIGASAGGLEALQDFFNNMPLNTGLAFVVIQHLSPDYKSFMNELLARQTKIPIHIIEDAMSVQPDNIYLIPPRKNLSIFHNKLYLEDQSIKKGLNLPVDIFFRSLAKDKGKKSIGVILSGTGSDGTLGTRAIKEAGGMVLVQEETTAKFDGMPRNSIATGLVDYILPPGKMPEALIDFIKHPFVNKEHKLEQLLSQNIDTITKIIIILRDYSGIDFSYYKENTIYRRLERRVSVNRLDSLEEYLLFLTESNKEKEILNRELLIGVTRFFRDTEGFDAIKNKVLPEITKNNSIRIWSAACSTGEEVYSITILLKEYISQNNLDCDIKVFATDIDKNSVEFASKGFYPESVMSDVDPKLLSKYFIKHNNGYEVVDSIRKSIVFATHNILKDSPFSKIDLLLCRNLFIYFKPEIQKKVLSMFYYSIRNDGYLFMGKSETVGDMHNAFVCVDRQWKIFKFKDDYKKNFEQKLPIFQGLSNNTGYLSYDKIILNKKNKNEKLFKNILNISLPPSVIIDSYDNIVHLINDTSKFIKMQPGDFSQNIFNNLSKEFSLYLGTLLRKLKKSDTKFVAENIISPKEHLYKKITIEGREFLHNSSTFYMISFRSEDYIEKHQAQVSTDFELDKKNYNRVNELEKELQFTKENLQATVEELETSNEELQSSNEELIASNEELQSTNEELQSVNEELYTVNSEYQTKIEELTKLNNDINNLLVNTEIGALYLDSNLCIRKITPIVSKITNILPTDIGRPITHLSLMNIENNVVQDVHTVVDTLKTIDKELFFSEGSIYLVRIRPYRTDYNAVDGILITFVDITHIKQEHKRANIATERLETALKIGNMAWWEWDLTTNTVIYDDRKATMLGYKPEDFPDDVEEVCKLLHPDEYEDVMQSMRDYLTGKSEAWDITYRIKRKDGGYSWYYDKGFIIKRDDDGNPLKLIGTVIDVSKIKILEIESENQRVLFKKILDNSPVAKTMVDAVGNITYANKKAEKLFGITKEQIVSRTFKSEEWEITDTEGKPINPDDLPFAIIKKTHKEVKGYKHYIKVPGKDKVLLDMYGVPIIDNNNKFEGAVFSLGVCNE